MDALQAVVQELEDILKSCSQCEPVISWDPSPQVIGQPPSVPKVPKQEGATDGSHNLSHAKGENSSIITKRATNEEYAIKDVALKNNDGFFHDFLGCSQGPGKGVSTPQEERVRSVTTDNDICQMNCSRPKGSHDQYVSTRTSCHRSSKEHGPLSQLVESCSNNFGDKDTSATEELGGRRAGNFLIKSEEGARDEQPIKRKRGRPRKTPEPEQEDKPRVRRRRGRPSKEQDPEQATGDVTLLNDAALPISLDSNDTPVGIAISRSIGNEFDEERTNGGLLSNLFQEIEGNNIYQSSSCETLAHVTQATMCPEVGDVTNVTTCSVGSVPAFKNSPELFEENLYGVVPSVQQEPGSMINVQNNCNSVQLSLLYPRQSLSCQNQGTREDISQSGSLDESDAVTRAASFPVVDSVTCITTCSEETRTKELSEGNQCNRQAPSKLRMHSRLLRGLLSSNQPGGTGDVDICQLYSLENIALRQAAMCPEKISAVTSKSTGSYKQLNVTTDFKEIPQQAADQNMSTGISCHNSSTENGLHLPQANPDINKFGGQVPDRDNGTPSDKCSRSITQTGVGKQVEQPIKRKRGRPGKPLVSVQEGEKIYQPVKRGLGRPRKHRTRDQITQEATRVKRTTPLCLGSSDSSLDVAISKPSVFDFDESDEERQDVLTSRLWPSQDKPEKEMPNKSSSSAVIGEGTTKATETDTLEQTIHPQENDPTDGREKFPLKKQDLQKKRRPRGRPKKVLSKKEQALSDYRLAKSTYRKWTLSNRSVGRKSVRLKCNAVQLNSVNLRQTEVIAGENISPHNNDSVPGRCPQGIPRKAKQQENQTDSETFVDQSADIGTDGKLLPEQSQQTASNRKHQTTMLVDIPIELPLAHHDVNKPVDCDVHMTAARENGSMHAMDIGNCSTVSSAVIEDTVEDPQPEIVQEHLSSAGLVSHKKMKVFLKVKYADGEPVSTVVVRKSGNNQALAETSGNNFASTALSRQMGEKYFAQSTDGEETADVSQNGLHNQENDVTEGTGSDFAEVNGSPASVDHAKPGIVGEQLSSPVVSIKRRKGRGKKFVKKKKVHLKLKRADGTVGTKVKGRRENDTPVPSGNKEDDGRQREALQSEQDEPGKEVNKDTTVNSEVQENASEVAKYFPIKHPTGRPRRLSSYVNVLPKGRRLQINQSSKAVVHPCKYESAANMLLPEQLLQTASNELPDVDHDVNEPVEKDSIRGGSRKLLIVIGNMPSSGVDSLKCRRGRPRKISKKKVSAKVKCAHSTPGTKIDGRKARNTHTASQMAVLQETADVLSMGTHVQERDATPASDLAEIDGTPVPDNHTQPDIDELSSQRVVPNKRRGKRKKVSKKKKVNSKVKCAGGPPFKAFPNTKMDGSKTDNSHTVGQMAALEETADVLPTGMHIQSSAVTPGSDFVSTDVSSAPVEISGGILSLTDKVSGIPVKNTDQVSATLDVDHLITVNDPSSNESDTPSPGESRIQGKGQREDTNNVQMEQEEQEIGTRDSTTKDEKQEKVRGISRSCTPSQKLLTAETIESPAKRPRGRPKKISSDQDVPKIKRPRGRPRIILPGGNMDILVANNQAVAEAVAKKLSIKMVRESAIESSHQPSISSSSTRNTFPASGNDTAIQRGTEGNCKMMSQQKEPVRKITSEESLQSSPVVSARPVTNERIVPVVRSSESNLKYVTNLQENLVHPTPLEAADSNGSFMNSSSELSSSNGSTGTRLCVNKTKSHRKYPVLCLKKLSESMIKETVNHGKDSNVLQSSEKTTKSQTRKKGTLKKVQDHPPAHWESFIPVIRPTPLSFGGKAINVHSQKSVPSLSPTSLQKTVKLNYGIHKDQHENETRAGLDADGIPIKLCKVTSSAFEDTVHTSSKPKILLKLQKKKYSCEPAKKRGRPPKSSARLARNMKKNLSRYPNKSRLCISSLFSNTNVKRSNIIAFSKETDVNRMVKPSQPLSSSPSRESDNTILQQKHVETATYQERNDVRPALAYRKRGRPLKNPNKSNVSQLTNLDSRKKERSAEIKVLRKVGRPRKNPNPVVETKEQRQVRKPSKNTIPCEIKAPRKVGRPRKSRIEQPLSFTGHASEQLSSGQDQGMQWLCAKSPAVTQKKRRGRPKKHPVPETQPKYPSVPLSITDNYMFGAFAFHCQENFDASATGAPSLNPHLPADDIMHPSGISNEVLLVEEQMLTGACEERCVGVLGSTLASTLVGAEDHVVAHHPGDFNGHMTSHNPEVHPPDETPCVVSTVLSCIHEPDQEEQTICSDVNRNKTVDSSSTEQIPNPSTKPTADATPGPTLGANPLLSWLRLSGRHPM